jgi:ferrous iron transport protein B
VEPSNLIKKVNIALVGNPNSGKSSIFNELTGLHQQVGNFPGVTVDKKTGTCTISEKVTATFIDLPGTYSLYPKRADEWVSYKVLLQEDETIKPDMILLVADASNLRRNLLFCSQIIDLKIPVVVALTMMDIAKQKGVTIDIPALEIELGVPIVVVNPRKKRGIGALKKAIELSSEFNLHQTARDFIYNTMLAPKAIEEVQQLFPEISPYKAIHYLINHEMIVMSASISKKIEQIITANKFKPTKTQAEEIVQRYAKIKHIMQQTVVEKDPIKKSLLTEKLDNLLLHRVWGYIILLSVLFVLFQSVFWVAKYPMNFIDDVFVMLGNWCTMALPNNWLGDLFVNGFLAGLSGIMIFVPQIMILFGLITLLEDSGYMARISFLTDRIMRSVGLNGKSIMPMISGFACAVPAIMTARNIENKKERLLTIMITPLMSCSARLPVYTILIALVIPSKIYFGVVSLQGMVMMFLYLFGTVMAMLVSWVMKWFIKSTERSFFILELPVYRSPRWKNMFYTMYEKARVFVFDAGKVIMLISLLLWALSTFGPPQKIKAVNELYAKKIQQMPADSLKLTKEKKTALLQNSFAGHLGKIIEPAIAPLGYDWKIGIALITSFAAREVFVGTMATLYSVGDGADENNATLHEKMLQAKRDDGTKVYTLATGLSLLLFYVLAMQCMSTIAIVKRETKSWKWPLIQLAYMTGLAYLCSLMIFQFLK